MSPHALEASGPGQAATREEVRDSGCRVCNNFPCLCRKSLIGSGLTRRITYKKVSMVDQRKFEGASKVSQEKLPGEGWEFNTVLTSAGGCHLDRRKTTSKSREGGRVPAHVCMGPQELVPFTAPPQNPHPGGTFLEHTFQSLPTLSWAVLFQQTPAAPQHPSAAGGGCHCLPAVLLNVF